MTEPSLAHIRDRELQERILRSGLMHAAQIQGLLTHQNQMYQSSHEQLRGQLYQVNLAEHQLDIKQSIELSSLNSVDLAPNHRQETDWQSWGRQVIVLHGSQPEVLQSLKWRQNQMLGLSLSESWNYLYTPQLTEQPWIMLTRHLIDPRSAHQNPKTGPYDLFIAHNRQLVCLTDRAAGDLYLIDPNAYRVTEIFTVRDQPSQKALLVEPDPARKCLYFIDQQQVGLGLLDYAEGIQENLDISGLKPVHLAFDGHFLYLLIEDPEALILKWDSQTQTEVARVRLPLPLYSKQQACAANPFALSPSGKLLAVLLGKNPDAEVCWLNTETLEILHHEDLAGQPLPIMLAFGEPNPLLAHRKHLPELLVEQGLVSRETLLKWFPAPVQTSETETELEIIGPETAVEPEPDPYLALPLPERNPDQESAAALLFLSPIESLPTLLSARKAESLPLPEQAEKDILQILSGSFFQHTGLDVEEYPEALERLQQEAKALRLQLQDHDIVPVDLPDILPGKALKTLLLRDSILLMLELRGTPERYPYDTPPSHCPACRVPLMGRWDCESCGLEILSPERAMARRTASSSARTWLPPGLFAITDVQSGRLLLVNTHSHKYVTWQIDFRHLPNTKQPWDTLWLDDLHVLLTDRGANRVLECHLSGRIHWELDTQHHPELRLLQPVKSTCRQEAGERRYLIVDQGHHRIIEVDAEQRLYWHYGVRGEAGSDIQHLNLPSDVQYTHEQTYLIADTGNDRVLEVSGQNVIHSWGLNLKLDRPVFAQRLFNGHVLIADAGNYRLLELDAHDEIFRETIYFREGMDERFDLSHPLKVIRRENQNVVLIDTNRIMEIDPLSKQIVWFSFLHELKMDLHFSERLQPVDALPAPSKMPQPEAFGEFKPLDAEHMPTLRRSLQKVPLFQEASAGFFQALESKLRFRRYKAGELILRKGQPWHSFFVLQSGQVAVLSGSATENVMFLEPGDSFGLMGIVYREIRTSSIRCETECGVYILDKRDFDEVLKAYPAIAAAVQKLAGERLVVARLKQTPKSQQAADRLQSLMATHRQRASERLAKISGSQQAPGHKPEPKRLHYSETEQKVIQAAQQEGLQALELHILLKVNTRMKAARVALIASVLDRLGTIIRTEPSPEALLEEHFGQELIMTVLTTQAQEQVSEDICALSDVLTVEIVPVELGA